MYKHLLSNTQRFKGSSWRKFRTRSMKTEFKCCTLKVNATAVQVANSVSTRFLSYRYSYESPNLDFCLCCMKHHHEKSLEHNKLLSLRPHNVSKYDIYLTLILPCSRMGTVWFYTSTSNKRAARPKLYTKSLTRHLKRMYSRFTLVRISINL